MSVPNPTLFPEVSRQLRRAPHPGGKRADFLGNARQSGPGVPHVNPDPPLRQAHLVFQVQDRAHRIISPPPYADSTFRIPGPARRAAPAAAALAEALLERGYQLVTGGTDTHLLLVDLRDKGLTGKAADAALGRAGIHVNKNTVPNETQSPFVTSGIRIGTPALTTRGMREPEMKIVGDLICEALSNGHSPEKLAAIRERTKAFCSKFPLFAMNMEEISNNK